MKQLPQTILFDQDGTIFDPVEGIHSCFNYALSKFSLSPVPSAEIYKYIGPSLRWSFGELLPEGSGEKEIDLAVEHYRELYFKDGWTKNIPYDGICEVLQTLRESGRTLFICTSRQQDSSRKILSNKGMDKYFHGIYGSDGYTSKGELLGQILQRHGINPADALLIGDRLYDAEAAKENGVSCAGALWGYGSRDELISAGADLLLENPCDILEYLSVSR